MTPFLKTVAADLYAKTGGRLDDVTIIFPNKRASLFFNQYLAELNGGKPMWLPRYVTITDIFSSLSPLTLCDPITLVCLLHQTYCKITHSTETLDKFYSWGEIMLNDFDDIDNNMINAKLLFGNAADLSNMTDFSFMSDTQREAVKTYFANFNPDKRTTLKDSFTILWDTLLPIYETFRADLLSAGLAYEGMLKRSVAEELVRRKREANEELGVRSEETYAVVGFNVLNRTEKTLFKHLKQHHTTHFYWDYDSATSSTDNFEAYRFIKENISIFGNAYAPESTPQSSFTPNHLRIISATTNNAQARYVEQWLGKAITPDTQLNRTAIVLCDESLLQPVVHSIPSLSCNITMGLPLSDTSAASLLQSLLNLQLRGQTRTTGTWYYDHAARLLRQPLIARITDGKSARIIANLQKNNIVYPNTTDLSDGNTTLSAIFTPQSETGELLQYLSTIFETVGKSFKNTPKDNFMHQLHIESVFNTYTIINRFTAIYQSGLLTITPHTLSRLLLQAVASKSVPFHGEPATGIQLMGMLETRNLDFDNLIILSANEGNLPKSEHITSLIPYTLREAFGMTTIEKRTSLYAYYFHRLIKRAKNIDILYSTSADNGARGEMSRFLLQLILESEAHSNLHISQTVLETSSVPMADTQLHASKTAELLQTINSKYNAASDPSAQPLTPSALNNYIDCPLKFYLSRLSPIPLRPANEIDEDIDNAQFGDIIHHVMEKIYSPHIGKNLTSADIEQLNNKERIQSLVSDELKAIFMPAGRKNANLNLTGRQLLNHHVITSYIQSQLKTDANCAPLRIISVEDKEHRLTLPVSSDTAVILYGIIDRLDRLHIEGTESLRVCDYKTSTTPHKTKSVEQLFDSAKEHRPYHILQVLIYSLILAAKGNEYPISPALLYLKKGVQDNVLSSVILMDKDPILDFATHTTDNVLLKDSLTIELQKLLDTLFSPTHEFTPTLNPDLCEYCDFRNLCYTSSNR